MRHILKFAFTTLAAILLFTGSIQSQVIISTPTPVCNVSIPAGVTWIVVNGGSVEVLPGCGLQVFGTLRIAPGGFVVIRNTADVYIAGPTGELLLDDYNTLLPVPRLIFDGAATMTIDANRYIDMGVRSQIQFTGAGIMRMAAGAFIRMDRSEIRNNTLAPGLIRAYGNYPFRGDGYFYNPNIRLYTDWNVFASDRLRFIDAGKITMDCASAGAPHDVNIYGSIEWYCNTPPGTFTFADCYNIINVYSGGMLYTARITMDNVPRIRGFAGSDIVVKESNWNMRNGVDISTEGAFFTDYGSRFDAMPASTWFGISFYNPSALCMINDAYITGLNPSAVGVYFNDATNTSNLINRTTIICPTGALTNGAYGIKMTGGAYPNSYLKITCSDITGFSIGLTNNQGQLVADGLDIYLNMVGLDVGGGTALVTRSLIRNNFSHGVTLGSIPATAPSFDMSHCAVVGNQGNQFRLQSTNNVRVDSSNVYYRTGNSTAVIVYASGSNANMPDCWWGRFPTVPAQFQLIASTVTHVPERNAAWLIDRGCIYPKQGNFDLTDPIAPTEAILVKNYPNPFNPSTTIEYQIPSESMVTVKVFNALGTEIATLVQEQKEAGTHRVEFNATAGTPSGLYLYEVRTPESVGRGTMMLTK